METSLLKEKREPSSESEQSDFIRSKSTSKVIKIFMKCTCKLIQHVENVLSKSNGFSDNSTTDQTNDGQDVKITERSMKEESEDAIRYLKSIKTCCIQLCLLCVDQNIYVDCTVDFKKIDFYSCLDDSTHSLVITYLTENIVYLIKHIGYLINMFKDVKNKEEAKDVRKSLLKIYKQIVFIPVNTNLYDTPTNLQNNSQWCNESMPELTEKLSLLRTALIKFKKIFKKKMLNPNFTLPDDNNSDFFQNIDLTPSNLKRKNGNVSDEGSSKKIKCDNGFSSPTHVFVIPESPNAAEKHKKKRRSKEIIETDPTYINSEANNIRINELVNVENRSIGSISDTESIKSKKKSKVKSKTDEIESIIAQSDTDSLKIKDNHEIHFAASVSDTESIKRKKKHKIKLVQNENIIKKNGLENTADNESLKTPEKHKKKHRNKEIIETDTILIESDTNNMKINKLVNVENRSIGSVSDTEITKREQNSKVKSKTDKIESIITLNDTDKHFAVSVSDTESLKRKKKHKIKLVQNEDIIKKNGESSTITLKTPEKKKKTVDNSDIKTPEKQNTNLCSTTKKVETNLKKLENGVLNPSKKNRSKSDSESSIISMGQLYTSRLEIRDENITINSAKKSPNKTKGKKISQNGAKKKLEDFVRKYESKKVKKLKKKQKEKGNEMVEHDIFGALSRGEYEVENGGTTFDDICREKSLSNDEKYIYIQNLLLEAKEKKEFSCEVKTKLENLHILIDWEVPEAHQIEKRISAGPLPEEIPRLAALGVSYKNFNLDEDNRIRKNWKNFCKAHDLDENPAPFLTIKHGPSASLKYAERKKFVQFLGKGLAHRALHSIYRRFKVLFRDKRNTGWFTAEEDELILIYCNKTNTNHRFVDLAEILNRERGIIERHYRKLTCKYKKERIKWTIETDSEIIHGLLEAIGSKNIEDLKHANLHREYFKKVASHFKISWEKVKYHWLKYVYPKLFATEPLHTGDIRMKIVDLLIKSNATDWKKIDWDEFTTSNFDGITKEFIWMQLILMKSQVAPKELKNHLKGMLEKCKKYIDRMKEMDQKPFKPKIIKRYKLSDDGVLVEYE